PKAPFGSFVRFLLLTAARRTEAAEMEWAEVVSGDWTLPASRNKTAQDLIRPLSQAALATLPERNGRWVFGNGARPLTVFVKPKARLDAASGVTGCRSWHRDRTSKRLRSVSMVRSRRFLCFSLSTTSLHHLEVTVFAKQLSDRATLTVS